MPIMPGLRRKSAILGKEFMPPAYGVDAAEFVFGTFLCCLCSFTRIFVRTRVGASTVQCPEGMERRDAGTDRCDQHNGRQHRDDV